MERNNNDSSRVETNSHSRGSISQKSSPRRSETRRFDDVIDVFEVKKKSLPHELRDNPNKFESRHFEADVGSKQTIYLSLRRLPARENRERCRLSSSAEKKKTEKDGREEKAWKGGKKVAKEALGGAAPRWRDWKRDDESSNFDFFQGNR